jgi:hypothetical protein
MLVRMWRKRNPYTVLVGMEISTTSMECSVEIPQKPEDRTAILSSDTDLGYTREGTLS